MFLITWLTRADKLKKMNIYVDNLMKLGSDGKKSKFNNRRCTPSKTESPEQFNDIQSSLSMTPSSREVAVCELLLWDNAWAVLTPELHMGITWQC